MTIFSATLATDTAADEARRAEADATSRALFPQLWDAQKLPVDYKWYPVKDGVTPRACVCGGLGYSAEMRPTPITHTYMPRAFCVCPQGDAKRAAAHKVFQSEYDADASRNRPNPVIPDPLHGLTPTAWGTLATATLASFEARGDAATTALASATAFASGAVEDRRGAFIHGPVGTGKTHLAIGIVKAMRARLGGPLGEYRIVTAPALARILGDARFGTKIEQGVARLERGWIAAATALIVDDLGTEEVSGPVLADLTELLAARFAAGSCTVITSNYATKTLLEKYGERFYSRWRAHALPIRLVGDDQRGR